ncbi:MAG: hypothetical protein KF862_26840 [Chitinophagaceae bacterium]|nr:hypothetical protein [Chitinophagaceae bacterium]
MAVQYAFRLMAPNQQKVPDEIYSHLKEAISHWGMNNTVKARQALEAAVQLADETGVL